MTIFLLSITTFSTYSGEKSAKIKKMNKKNPVLDGKYFFYFSARLR